MSLAPLDLVSAHPWQRVVFTTYALSLSFFEAAVLDALVRGGGSQALILADVHGVRASLSEQGAQRVGKDYEVEPVAVTNGVFHPKISVLSAEDECHILVGSGNLTFGGWGGNCEFLEHLHPSFAADAISDAADFFTLLATTERVRHSVAPQCAAIAADLRRSVRSRTGDGNIRLIHSLTTSISEQIAQTASDLGGAVKLTAAAPFWDTGVAIDRLCELIGLDHIFVHAHQFGYVEGVAASNWPRECRTKVHAVRIGVLDDPEERRLHAKAFEVLCKRGRILISGSANSTAPALERERNVEACVTRIQREQTVGWTLELSEPPVPQARSEEDSEADGLVAGVLRASVEGDALAGRVMTPKLSGPVSIYHLAGVGAELIAETDLDSDGCFSVSTPGFEQRSWRGGRLVIRVESANGRRAEGFVSVSSFAEIARRTGALGARLLALVGGTETPDDVVAIISWFYENSERLGEDTAVLGGGSRETNRPEREQFIPVKALGQYADAQFPGSPHDANSQQTWSRFFEQILLAFREPRGPFERTGAGQTDDDEGETSRTKVPPAEEDPAIAKSLSMFDKLFARLTRPGTQPQAALVAFDLTQYVSARLQAEPQQVGRWLDATINILLEVGVPPQRREDVAAATLILLAASPGLGAARFARARLLRLGVDFSGPAPQLDGVRSYLSALPQLQPLPDLWLELRSLRTYQEQVRSLVQAIQNGKPSTGYPDLPNHASKEWPTLEAAVHSAKTRGRVLFAGRSPEVCPSCHMRLPSSEIQRLRTIGIATTKSCCARVVIWLGE